MRVRANVQVRTYIMMDGWAVEWMGGWTDGRKEGEKEGGETNGRTAGWMVVIVFSPLAADNTSLLRSSLSVIVL